HQLTALGDYYLIEGGQILDIGSAVEDRDRAEGDRVERLGGLLVPLFYRRGQGRENFVYVGKGGMHLAHADVPLHFFDERFFAIESPQSVNGLGALVGAATNVAAETVGVIHLHLVHRRRGRESHSSQHRSHGYLNR